MFGESGSGETSGGYAEIVSGTVSGRGGGVVVRNAYVSAPDGSVQPCPLQVNATSPNAQVCVGEWCPSEPAEPPMSGTASQWGTVLREALEADRDAEE